MRVTTLLAFALLSCRGFDASAAKQTLLDLAQRQFSPRPLTKAEKELFVATENGEPASMLNDDEKHDDPADAATWPKDRVIRAESLSWLCTNREALALITHRGIKIFGMRIDGDFDLKDAHIPFPLSAWKSSFNGDVFLTRARMRSLFLVNCPVKSLNAVNTQFEGDVFLNHKFKAEGGVNLAGAKISGTLDCQNARLSNPSGRALNANGATINGSVFLREGFQSEGEVNFQMATIGGNLECDGAQLADPDGTAFKADDAKITGSVFLREGFKAEGEVNLLGASIGGNLECSGAHLINSKGRALSADGGKINGSVALSNRFKSEGEVNFVGVTIDGNLDCEGAQLINSKATALIADGGKINGSVFLRKGFKSEGEVNFLGATIGGSLECQGAQLINPSGNALVVDRAKITGNVFLQDHFSADGIVDFQGAMVEGTFFWADVKMLKTTILKLQSAKFGTLHGHKETWPHEGKLYLDGLVYTRIQDRTSTTGADRTKWLGLQPNDQPYPQPYEQLASVLRTMGREGEVVDVMIGKNRQQQRFTHPFSAEWWWYDVFGRLIGYGYQPSRPFFMSLALITLGAFLFRFGYCAGLIGPIKETAYQKKDPTAEITDHSQRLIVESYPRFNAFVYSLESFTPLLKLDQSSNWAPNANRRTQLHLGRMTVPVTGSVLRVYLWSHIILGWVLTSLWVGSITGLVKS